MIGWFDLSCMYEIYMNFPCFYLLTWLLQKLVWLVGMVVNSCGFDDSYLGLLSSLLLDCCPWSFALHFLCAVLLSWLWFERWLHPLLTLLFFSLTCLFTVVQTDFSDFLLWFSLSICFSLACSLSRGLCGNCPSQGLCGHCPLELVIFVFIVPLKMCEHV